MPRKSKLSTPAWILEGYDSKEAYEKVKGISKEKKPARTFKIKECPKCGSDDVGVVLTGEEGKVAKNWECRKCKWVGGDVAERDLEEDEFMEYLDEKGEEVA